LNELNVGGTVHHIYEKEDTVKVKLMKMSKGYQWELTYENTDNDILLAKLKDLDTKLRSEYQTEEK